MGKKTRTQSAEPKLGLPSLGLRGSVSPELVERLRTEGGLRTLQPGEELFRQGAKPDEVFLIINGKVMVTEDTVPVGELDIGELAGIKAIVLGQPHTGTARATTACEVYPLTAGQLMMHIRNTDAGGWVIIYAIRRADALERALVDRTQSVTNFRERVSELERRLQAKDEAVNEITGKRDAVAARLEPLMDENGRLEKLASEYEKELAGLRTDLSSVNRELADNITLLHQARKAMEAQHERADKAEKRAGDQKVVIDALRRELSGVRENLHLAGTQLGDSQRERDEARAKLAALEASIPGLIAQAQASQAEFTADLYYEFCKTQKEAIDLLTLEVERLRRARDTAQGVRPGVARPSLQSIKVSEVLVAVAEKQAKLRPSIPPPPPAVVTTSKATREPIAGEGALDLDMSGLHTATPPPLPTKTRQRHATMAIDPDSDDDVQVFDAKTLTPPPAKPTK